MSILLFTITINYDGAEFGENKMHKVLPHHMSHLMLRPGCTCASKDEQEHGPKVHKEDGGTF